MTPYTEIQRTPEAAQKAAIALHHSRWRDAYRDPAPDPNPQLTAAARRGKIERAFDGAWSEQP